VTGWVIGCSASCSAGGTWPSSPCTRRLLYQSMYSTVAISRSSSPRHGPFVADEFGLVEGVERLGHRVVERVALRTDRRDSAGLGEALGVADRPIVDSTVCVVHESLQVSALILAAPDRQFQRVQRQVGVQRRGHLPADDLREYTSRTNAAYTQPTLVRT
jgi:hypothetical protein